jgi:hypothetical protein
LSVTGSSTYISIYLVGCCAVALVALPLMPRRALGTPPTRLDEAVERGTIEEAPAGARRT